MENEEFQEQWRNEEMSSQEVNKRRAMIESQQSDQEVLNENRKDGRQTMGKSKLDWHPDKRDAHPSVQNDGLRLRKKACG